MSKKDVFGHKFEQLMEYGINDGEIDVNANIGTNLKSLRKYVGLKQTDLAEITYIAVKRIRSIEQGALPNSEELELMRPYLGFSYERLIVGNSCQTVSEGTNLGLNDKTIEWLREKDKGSKQIYFLNLLFREPEIIESLLDAMQLYSESAYKSTTVVDADGNTQTLRQHHVMEIYKSEALREISKALDLLINERYIAENRKSILYEIKAQESINKFLDRRALILNKLEKLKQRQKKRAEQEDIEDFDREAEEYKDSI